MQGHASQEDASSLSEQEEVAAFLSDPKTHGEGITKVERIDTHASLVFLAGDRAYKLKRALRYPYLDYGTLEKRRLCCVKEVALNRRTAPQIYLGVTAITRGPDGLLSLGGEGEARDWVVVMRRFDQDCLFDALARSDRLTPALLSALADEIANFHEGAERLQGSENEFGGAGGLLTVLEETLMELQDDEELFPAKARADLTKEARNEFGQIALLLEERRDQGFVRRCHGDLHLRNICLLEGRPRLFDGIEFNDGLSCIDTLYDLAFLLMDLEHRGLRPMANLVLNRYLRGGKALSGLATLPLFLALRALIRAKVNASAARLEAPKENDDPRSHDPAELAIRSHAAEAAKEMAAEAATYFREAAAFLAPPAPCLVAIGGLSGSGKSSLARHLAPRLGPAPGALVLRSDVLRKAIFGVDDADRLPKNAYRPEVSKQVYAELRSRARSALAAGHSVIVDALQNHPRDRAAIEKVARDPDLVTRRSGSSGPAFHGFWLDAPRKVLEARIREREQPEQADASDADVGVLAQQLAEDPGPLSWTKLDASRDLTTLVDEAESAIGQQKPA